MPALCRSLRTTGFCGNSACQHRHDLRICEICSVVCTSDAVYKSHITGKRHLAQIRGDSATSYCTVCAKMVGGGARSWSMHVAGRPHQKKAANQGVPPNVQPELLPPSESAPDGYQHCGLCNKNIRTESWSLHLSSSKHQKMQKYAAHQAVIGEATKDKHGVTISPEEVLNLGIISSSETRSGVEGRLVAKNTVPLSRIMFVSAQLISKSRNTPWSIDATAVVGELLVHGRDSPITIKCKSTHDGHFEDRVEFVFEDVALKQQFVIVRFIRLIVGDRDVYERLKPTTPYTPRIRSKREPETKVFPGEAPPATNAVPYVTKLPPAPIPKSIASVMNTGTTKDKVNSIRNTILPKILDVASHGRYFKTLLWIEEKRSEEDLEIYDEHDGRLTLNQSRKHYLLEVAGLAEKRPSVLVGDRILVQRHGSDKGHWYEGHVHFVHQKEVGLQFHCSFTGHNPGHRYNVRFKLNRIPLRRQHQALDVALRGEHLFFPVARHIAGLNAPTRVVIPYNPIIALNPAQMQAIRSILSMKDRSVPFVVFGPPGTGKTVTIVEAIRQILRHNPNARILACAPSNSAADLIASRLTMYSQDQLFRFYAPSRTKKDVPDKLVPFVYEKQMELDRVERSMRDYFSVPPMTRLRRFNIIVSTCVSASVAYGVGLQRGHFTHIFIDEAGQATEPEAMISIKTMADDQTKVILSGDPKQLGPIVRCPVARELELDTSYLERMMKSDIYSEDSPNTGITWSRTSDLIALS
ncbi:hypothetical protein NEOLEDRAFT_442878 [Neolentinus lepideus HHB14362 ss-1]|uniref:U1-type domain-containing protein n=1 Tax=Neolentinus lepideus HHB14362 ss-1 TaxID=1314782 RepID=A0A165RQW1_9AGAM|nr:hypothetical protein NEOLEDRAFT_442878 [Neolentinus lepideus HHB14362 ss-1]